MAQVIVLDYITSSVSIYDYDMKTYPEVEDLLKELNDDGKISDLKNCSSMSIEDDMEIIYETI